MTELVNAIDSWVQNRYSRYDLKLYGLCELTRKTANSAEQVMPMTMPNLLNSSHERTQVSLDDRYELITWMRWAEQTTYENSEDWSFGKDDVRVGLLPIRLVVAHKVILGEDLIFDFINAFPTKFNIPGFQFAFVDSAPSIDPDHEAIYQTELGPTVYEKHRFEWNIYVLNINLQFLECEELTP